MPRRVIRDDHKRVALLDAGVAIGGVRRWVPQLDAPDRPGRVAAVEHQDRRRMLEAGAGERRLVGIPGNDPGNRQTVEPRELGLYQRCQLGVRLMQETAGGVHVLANMVEPKTGGVAVEPTEDAMVHDL